jgi:flagellin
VSHPDGRRALQEARIQLAISACETMKARHSLGVFTQTAEIPSNRFEFYHSCSWELRWLMALSFSGITGFASSTLSLSRTQSALTKAFAQLSSGKRINSAADDAAGLAIASALAASVTKINQASRNVSDTSSALAIADGALSQVSEITNRLQELATTAANGTYTDEQRQALQSEYASLSAEIQRIGETTNFNGKPLLGGSPLSATVGPGGETLEVGGVNLQSLAGTLTAHDISTQAGATNASTAIQQFSQELNTQRSGSIDAATARLETIQNNLSSQRTATSESLSRIEDADLSSGVADTARAKALLHYQVSLIKQAHQLRTSTYLSLLG